MAPHRRIHWIVWGATLSLCIGEVLEALFPRARPVVARNVTLR